MAGPYLQLGNGVTRVESKLSRESTFAPFKDLIKILYVEKGWPLKDVRNHISEEYNVHQS